MQAGVCAGVDGTGPADCVNTGWSPNWLPPSAFADVVDDLLDTVAETVCPWCLLDRAAAGPRIPGFNRNKYIRIKAVIDGKNCSRVGGSRSTGHTHLYDFVNEDLHAARQEPPGQSERGY